MNIKNYQEDVINKLQIHKTADNVSAKDAFKMLDEYKGDFDCVSTLKDEIIKPDYKITNDHMIAIVPITGDGDLFRFNKIQLMDDNVVIDNVVIDKIQFVVRGQVVIDDLETFNIYFPRAPGQEYELRVFINKTYITRSLLGNIMLTYERVFLNNPLRMIVNTENYELFEGTKYENHRLIITPTDNKEHECNEDCVSYLINPDQSSYRFNRSAHTIYDIEIQTVDINMNEISNKISKVSVQIGATEVYNKTNADNYYLEVFNETNPIPLRYLMYWNVTLNIITDEPKQLILIKYKQKNINDELFINNYKTPFYMNPNILIEGGMGKLTDPSELVNIPYISKFI